MRELAQQQIGFAAIHGDQFRDCEMGREMRFLGMLPGLDFVKEAGQLMRFPFVDLQQLARPEQGTMFRGKGEAIDDFHAAMNS